MVTYKEFELQSIFNITRGRRVTKADQEPGDIPYVTAYTSNNGIDSYIDNPIFTQENILTASFLGDVFYHPYEVGYKDGTYGLKLKTHIKESDKLYLYIGAAIEKHAKQNASYSKNLILDDYEKMKISLPTTVSGHPDFDYMENYIKDIEQKHIKKLESDLATRTENLFTVIGCEDLISDPDGLAEVVAAGFDSTGVDYAEFRVGDLFDVQRGRRLKGADREPGDVVYCSATQSNNGVTDYIDNPLFIAKNKVTVSTFLDVFYQEGEFTASDEITMLGADWLDRSSGLFIATAIKKSQHGYGYGHKAFSKEVSNFVIDLPVTSTGQPDFDYMAQYIAHIEIKYTHTLMQWTKAKESI